MRVDLSRPAVDADSAIALRLLATSDLHAHILPWDDVADCPAPGRGLALVASLIHQARSEQPQCLLLDNGDFLNGSALGDFLAECAGSPPALHPMIAAMNLLGYDAATLGNHEFSHGLDHLNAAIRRAAFPLVSANLYRRSTAKARQPFLPPFTLLRRGLTDGQGNLHDLTIGITGFLPPQTMLWERRNLAGRLEAEDIVQAAKAVIPRMRRAGADIVIVLAHSGIGGTDHGPGAENALCLLADLPGVDALIGGHTHQLFPPATDHADSPPSAARLLARPVIMPGFFGSHLGVIDLQIERHSGRWTVTQHHKELRPVAQRQGADLKALVPSRPEIAALAAHDLARMRRRADDPVGETATPLTSHFALLGHSAVQPLLAAVQIDHCRRQLAGGPLAGLPVLAAVAPFKAGGRGGPKNYTNIAAGMLTHRHVTDLYLHPNSPVALRLSGAEIADWLERAVSLFHQLQPGRHDQPLINPAFPAYNFDLLHGLRFEVDLRAPARFDCNGVLANPDARRIVGLQHEGQPIAPDHSFIVATNSYRASGGAGFAGADLDHIVAESAEPLRRVLADYIRAKGRVAPQADCGWGLRAMPGTSALFDTSPQAKPPPALGLQELGLQSSGFLRFRLNL